MTDEANLRFEHATPILRVADFDASVAYYVEVLGFRLAWRAGAFGCVKRGEAALMLSEGAQGHVGSWIYVGVSDADALHIELLGRGARIRHAPTNFPWGSRELHVFDPDGNVLRFGSEARAGEPLGPWLEEDGTRWLPRPGGGWEKMS
jgi:catechol 2,3-dioxygenase-like lactoylglutathione lyase family enzyme